MAAFPAHAYQEHQVTTVGRGQLLLMAYDGALRFLEEGKRAIRANQFELKNHNLQKAQRLLLEFLQTLDHQASPDLAERLDRLYRYMYDRLTYANVNDDERAVMEVAGLLGELRQAWGEAELKARSMDGSMSGGH